MSPPYLAGLFFLFVCNCSMAQPTPRSSAQLFYIPSTQSLVLFDGYEKGTMPASSKAETWAWKNNNWTKIDETDQPMRSLGGAAYISDLGLVFVFGGVGSKGYDDTLKQTYSFDGSKWKNIVTNSMGTRDHHEMVYDENNKAIVLYGGQTSSREFDTLTWIYKNEQWTALAIPGPGPRVHHAMAYDAERKRTVLFGGSGKDQTHDDTWEFDGTRWEKINAPQNPRDRAHHVMVYDPSRKKVLLHGGEINMEMQGDTWSWDGKAWVKLSDHGPARILPALAFNTDNNKLYVFGGNGGEQAMLIYSDLWEWDGHNWKQLDSGKVYEWNNGKDRFVEKK